MEKREIYVRSDGKDYGPFDANELSEHLSEGKLPFSIWIYQNESWEMLASNVEFREKHCDFEPQPQGKPSRPKAKIIAATPLRAVGSARTDGVGGVSNEPLWFVIADKKKQGPYSAADIIEQLQSKKITRTAFVWRPGFSTWQKLSNVSDFSKKIIQALSSQKASMDILVKRKYPRSPYEVKVIAHDNRKAIQGKSMVIGEGGMFLNTAKPTHPVGARLKIHFRDDKLPSFNVVAEIISVVRSGTTPGYCLKFVAISSVDRKRISKFTKVTNPEKEIS